MSGCSQYTTHHACECVLEQVRYADQLAHAAKEILRQSVLWRELGGKFGKLKEAVTGYEASKQLKL